MLRGKENNAGDAKVWAVDDDITLWDQLQSEVPAPKLAKSPKVAALVAKLSASADEIVARFGELLDPLGPARYRLDEAVRAKSARGLAQAKKTTSGAGAKPKKKKARVATPAPPRREDLLDMMLDGPPDGSQVFVRWQGAPGPERDGYWRATVERSSDGKLWLVGHDFDPAFGEPMPFDPVQTVADGAPRGAPRGAAAASATAAAGAGARRAADARRAAGARRAADAHARARPHAGCAAAGAGARPPAALHSRGRRHYRAASTRSATPGSRVAQLRGKSTSLRKIRRAAEVLLTGRKAPSTTRRPRSRTSAARRSRA